MCSFWKRKYAASTVARELAKFALHVEEYDRPMIDEVAEALEVSPQRVEAEYRHLRVYTIETVIHTVSEECEAGDALRVCFERQVREVAGDEGLGTDYWPEYQRRVPGYDKAFLLHEDAAVAMSLEFAKRLKSEDAVLEAIPLWLRCAHLIAPMTRYLRGRRIVDG